jgi:predicted DCC family thiol-disulfide oxidoreductase YuxK
MDKRPEHLILYDPFCKLCTTAVKYVIKNDKQKIFYYGSLYSQKGKLFKKTLTWAQQKNTIIYFEFDKVYTQSDAILQIISKLRGMHRGFILFKYLPKSFRDHLYKFIAKYRYNWFGKRKKPYVPDLSISEKFVDYNELMEG